MELPSYKMDVLYESFQGFVSLLLKGDEGWLLHLSYIHLYFVLKSHFFIPLIFVIKTQMNGTPDGKVLTPQKPVNLLPEVPNHTSRKLSDREQHDCDVIGTY